MTIFAVNFSAGAGELDAKGFITEWLIRGPYPNYQTSTSASTGGEGFNTDWLSRFGGETGISPQVGNLEKVEFIADFSKLVAGVTATNEWGSRQTEAVDVAWQPLKLPPGQFQVILNKKFDKYDDYIVAYAACTVYSPIKQEIKVRVGSDDDNKVWLNGELIGSANSSQGIIADNFIYQATLQKGLNRLLVKNVDRTGDFGFCLALSDRNNIPLKDIRIYLESPADIVIRQHAGLKQVLDWDDGFYLGAKSSISLWTGNNPLSLTLGAPLPGQYKFKAIMKQNGHIVAEQNGDFSGNDYTFEHDWILKKANKALLEVVLYNSSGQAIRLLAHEFTVNDREELEKENAVLEKQIADVPKTIREFMGKKQKYMQNLTALKEQKKALLLAIENAYEEQHRKNAAMHGNTGKSIDDNFDLRAPARKIISLNGDQWQVSAAEKADGEKTFYSPAQKTQTIPAAMPFIGFDEYFRTWNLPIKNVDQKNPYGAVESLPGWEHFQYNKLLCARRVWLHKKLSIDFAPSQYAVQFCAENVCGRIRVYINGEFEKEYRGIIGLVNLPLTKLSRGDNRIDIFFEEPQTAGIPELPGLDWGIRGDVSLLFTAPVHTDFAVIRTSWRENRLAVETTVKNSSIETAEIKVVQYVTLNGRIKKRLPDKTIKLGKNGEQTFEVSTPWTDPELWGIGDRCGSPVLYQLVTDLYVQNKLVDRNTTTFGFREVWVAGTDLFMNGKRIFLQGDVGVASALSSRKYMNVLFPLLRADGINTIRNHDSTYWNPEFFRTCDRLGMYAYANMYPILHEGKPDMNSYTSVEKWLKHPYHQINLENYRRWIKMVRNHPSVIVLSTDNEIFTQAWDRANQREFNERNDQLGAWYGRFVKALTPEYIHTRNGDVGTWGWDDKWHETPPCETANYHYPDFDLQKCVVNWQSTFKFRPLIYGETVYCAYFINNRWVNPTQELVATRAEKLRTVISAYRQWEVPGQIYMGLSSDGFVKYDETGKGNPFGITAKMIDSGKTNIIKGYPMPPIEWPALSGPGTKTLCAVVSCNNMGTKNINWFDPRFPSHIRTEVNNAYRDNLLPMPPLAADTGAECVVQLASGNANVPVTAISPDQLSGQEIMSLTDSTGKAYFELPAPGKYTFSAAGVKHETNLMAIGTYAAQPGFNKVPQITVNDK